MHWFDIVPEYFSQDKHLIRAVCGLYLVFSYNWTFDNPTENDEAENWQEFKITRPVKVRNVYVYILISKWIRNWRTLHALRWYCIAGQQYSPGVQFHNLVNIWVLCIELFIKFKKGYSDLFGRKYENYILLSEFEKFWKHSFNFQVFFLLYFYFSVRIVLFFKYNFQEKLKKLKNT